MRFLGPFAAGEYTNFIRQVQLPSGVQWDATVAATGEQKSVACRWIRRSAFRIVDGFVRAVDQLPAGHPLCRRLRAHRRGGDPFRRPVSGGAPDPRGPAFHRKCHRQRIARRSARIPRPQGGEIAPPRPILRGRRHRRKHRPQPGHAVFPGDDVTENGTQTLNYTLTSVPRRISPRARARSVFRSSLWRTEQPRSPNSPPTTFRSGRLPTPRFPGIADGQKIRFQLPQLTLTYNDLYPESQTYAQVYPGRAALGVEGAVDSRQPR